MPDDNPRELLLFNQKMTARLLGISVQAFANWNIAPTQRRGRLALYYWPDVAAEAKRRTTEPYERRIEQLETELAELRAAVDSGDELDLEAERARLAAAQADKYEMENAIKRGEIAYLPDMAAEQGRVFEMIRAHALELPTGCAPLANPENPNLARDVIERGVHELLANIADAELDAERAERADAVRRSEVDASAAAEANGHGVGRSGKVSKPRKQRAAGKVAN